MNPEQTDIANQAWQRITTVLDSLMQPNMNTARGIEEAREAVVNAQNAINRLLDQ